MRRFVVVGLGNFGGSAAESLHAQGHEVVVVDPSEAAVDRISPYVTRAIVGDGRVAAVLERAGAKGADAGIVSTGDDITASILATMSLRDLGVPEVFVKVISREHARVMERIGITEAIFPERETAMALAARLSGKALLNYVRLGAGVSVQEMAVPEEWNRRTLRELSLRKRHRVAVVALHDVLTDEMFVWPDPDVPLKDSDALLVAGKDEDLAKIAQLK